MNNHSSDLVWSHVRTEFFDSTCADTKTVLRKAYRYAFFCDSSLSYLVREAGVRRLLQSLIFYGSSTRDIDAVEGGHVISWRSNRCYHRLVYRCTENKKTISHCRRQARLDSSDWSLFWKNRELHQW